MFVCSIDWQFGSLFTIHTDWYTKITKVYLLHDAVIKWNVFYPTSPLLILHLSTWIMQSIVHMATNNRQSKDAIRPIFMFWTRTQHNRSVDVSTSSNNYRINAQLKWPFLLMSSWPISPAFNIYIVCICILPTGKLLNEDSKRWTVS